MKFVIIIFALFSSMALTANNSERLYDEYFLYKEAARLNDYALLSTYITSDNRKHLMESGAVEDFNEVFPMLSSFPFIIEKEINNYQLIDGDRGCFTVNGLDSELEPTSINLEYKKEGNSWRLNSVHIAYYSSEDEFIKSATCPLRPQ